VAHLRDIREEAGYTHAIGEMAKKFPRVREVEEALHWSLARDPAQHYQVPDTKYHIVQTLDYEEITDLPAIRVLYWFDAERVYLLSAMMVRRA
jgi:hypothetical protein